MKNCSKQKRNFGLDFGVQKLSIFLIFDFASNCVYNLLSDDFLDVFVFDCYGDSIDYYFLKSFALGWERDEKGTMFEIA